MALNQSGLSQENHYLKIGTMVGFLSVEQKVEVLNGLLTILNKNEYLKTHNSLLVGAMGSIVRALLPKEPNLNLD